MRVTINGKQCILNFRYEECQYFPPDKSRRRTVAQMYAPHQKPDGCDLYPRGEAYCHPKDHFDRRVGRRLALTRLLKVLGLEREARKQVWEAYFSQTADRKTICHKSEGGVI